MIDEMTETQIETLRDLVAEVGIEINKLSDAGRVALGQMMTILEVEDDNVYE